MIDLESDQLNIEIVDVRLAGGMITYYVRRPTTKEQFLYQSNKIERKGNKIINKTHIVRQEYAKQILQGFEVNSELCMGDKPLSPNSEDLGYREDWREMLSKGVPEHLDIIAQVAFDAAREKPTIDENLQIEVAESEQEESEQEEQADGSDSDGEVETLESPLGKS